MAKKEIVIPNLIPGKRYRMVVETPITTGQPTLLAPSIEFVVPSAPRLISTYTPTFSVISDPWSTSTTTTTTVPGTWVEAGANRAAASYTFNLGGWYYVLNSNVMEFYTNDALTGLGAGMTVTISNFGATYDGAFTINGISTPGGTPYSATNSLKPRTTQYFSTAISATCSRRSGHQTAKTSNNGTISYSIPADPATRYQNASTTSTSTVVTSGTYYHVDVTVPSEIQKDLLSTDTVKKVPVFFYIQNGQYYYFDGSVVGSTPLTLSTTPVAEMKKRNLNANENVAGRDYRFTIAKYTKTGSNWYGEWEQKLDTYESLGPSFSRVIISQSAVRV